MLVHAAGEASTRQEAVHLANRMLTLNLIHHVTHRHEFQDSKVRGFRLS